MQTETKESVDQVLTDLRKLVRDSEDLLKAGVGELNEKGREARARLETTLKAAKDTCHNIEDRAIAGAKAADKAIREHPYESMGIAFGVGMLIGVLVTRK